MFEILCWLKSFVLEAGAISCVVVPSVVVVFGLGKASEFVKRYIAFDKFQEYFVKAVCVIFLCVLLFAAGFATWRNKQGICERGFNGQWHHIWSGK